MTAPEVIARLVVGRVLERCGARRLGRRLWFPAFLETVRIVSTRRARWQAHEQRGAM